MTLLNKCLSLLLLNTSLALSFNTYAALIDADYLIEQDNLAVYDTTQNLKWLDLSVSEGWTISTWEANVQAGYGWRLATNTEVETMLTQAFPSIDVLNFSSYYTVRDDADLNYFTSIFGQSADQTRSYGLYIDEDSIWRLAGNDNFTNHYAIWGAEHFVNYANIASQGESWFSMYIVKDEPLQTPIPGPLVLSGLGLILMMKRK